MSKVVELDFDRIPVIPKRHDEICRHSYVLACEKTRMLQCDKCGKIIDPFDFIYEWACRDRNLEHTRKVLKEDCERLRLVLKDLKRQERNISTRIKRQEKM